MNPRNEENKWASLLLHLTSIEGCKYSSNSTIWQNHATVQPKVRQNRYVIGCETDDYEMMLGFTWYKHFLIQKFVLSWLGILLYLCGTPQLLCSLNTSPESDKMAYDVGFDQAREEGTGMSVCTCIISTIKLSWALLIRYIPRRDRKTTPNGLTPNEVFVLTRKSIQK